MIWIGKGLATIGLWAGLALLGFFGIIIFIGPIVAMVVGLEGTKAIWSSRAPKECCEDQI